MAFAYLWEAEFYMRVHALISERTTSGIAGPKHEAFQTFLREGATLATIESPLLPSTRKNAAGAMNAALAMGYVARRRFLEERWQSEPTLLPDSAVETIVEDWVEEMNARGRLGDLAARLVTDANTAKNTREFVRYLLLPRVADDDSADQADFYSLARSNSRNFWFEPGPEWLVVNTALLGEYSGGQCTLGMLVEDLSRLGIRVERWVLVGMLEESGLSTDSPDADSALVIRSGF